MFLRFPGVLDDEEVRRIRSLIEPAGWVDGNITAGLQSGQVKHNLQLPGHLPAAQAAQQVVLQALSRHAGFFAAALPRTVFPPLFNRYAGAANRFGAHVDNALRLVEATGQRLRTDLSCTLFLSAPDEYDGGELRAWHDGEWQAAKGAAGELVMYASTTVHEVAPVTHGVRLASFFWVQSLVRDDGHRRLLRELDAALLGLRARVGDCAEVVALTGTYHNLLRRWAEP